MNIYGLIGHPLHHSFSKKYFTEKFKKENIFNSEYKLFDLKSIKEFQKLIKNIPEIRGLNVTIPYKESIIPLLNEINSEATKIGAVNTIHIQRPNKNDIITKGYNTDIYGFEKSLKPYINFAIKKALILGTGGAAKAVAYVFRKNNIEYLFVSRSETNRNKRIINYSILDRIIIKNILIIVSTIPLGTNPNTENYPNIPYKFISEKHILYDLIYNPNETIFLKKGKKNGAITKNGLEMLYLQAEKSWEIFK